MMARRYWTLAIIFSIVGAGMTACSSTTGSPAVPPTIGSTSPASASTSPEASESDGADRLQAGQIAILTIDQATRDELRAAAGGANAPGSSGSITNHGTIYYGKIYGKTPKTDTYYVLALIDQMYVWRREGDAAWTYKGSFDARVCAPPIPRRLYSAWGVGGTFPRRQC